MFSALRNKKFKLDTGFSPFSYFTTIAFHAFINRIKKENKHHEVLNEYKEKVYTDHMIDPDKVGGAHIYVDPGTTCDEDNYNSTQ
jgi:DNA-directed RNA polymerase specialized sigma24 family protein